MTDFPRRPTLPGPPDHTPTPVEGVPFHHYQPPPPRDHSGPIDINRLRVPFMLTLSALAFVVGAIFGIAGAWFSLSAHANNHVIHLEESVVTSGGGPAMKNDVNNLRGELTHQVADSQAKMRKMLRHATISCHRAGTGLTCEISVPEDE